MDYPTQKYLNSLHDVYIRYVNCHLFFRNTFITMVIPAHVAKHNGEQCTAYSRKHNRCPFKVVKTDENNHVCLKHTHYYEDWWYIHSPVIGWRSAGRNIQENYKNGFCFSGPPPQRYIDNLVDNVIFFDYWVIVCLTFPETCTLDQKPNMLYTMVDEYVRGRFPIHNEEWQRLFENPDGGVRPEVVKAIWKNSCAVFFKKFTALYKVLVGWWGEHSPDEIARCIMIQFHDDIPFLEKMIIVIAKAAPWYFFCGEMEEILLEFQRGFMKECRRDFYQLQGKKCMDRISQKVDDTKQGLYETLQQQSGIMSEFFEELVATVWHPRRVGPWIEAYGIDILESF